MLRAAALVRMKQQRILPDNKDVGKVQVEDGYFAAYSSESDPCLQGACGGSAEI